MREEHRREHGQQTARPHDERSGCAIPGNEALGYRADEQEQDDRRKRRADQADLPQCCRRHVVLGGGPRDMRGRAAGPQVENIEREIPGKCDEREPRRLVGVVVPVDVGDVARPVVETIDPRRATRERGHQSEVRVLIRAGSLDHRDPSETDEHDRQQSEAPFHPRRDAFGLVSCFPRRVSRSELSPTARPAAAIGTKVSSSRNSV